MDNLARRNGFVDQLKTSAKVPSDSALARALGVEKHKIAYWRSETGKIDTDLTIEFFRSETIDFLQSLVDDLRGSSAEQLAQKTAESAYYEQAGRSFEQAFGYLSAAKSILSNAEMGKQEETAVTPKPSTRHYHDPMPDKCPECGETSQGGIMCSRHTPPPPA